MSQEFNKKELVNTLKILLDLSDQAAKDLAKLEKATLQEMYANYITNAKKSNADWFKARITTK